MTKELKTIKMKIFAELKRLFGLPQIPSMESKKTYNKMLLRIIEHFMPRDFNELLLTRQLADSDWEIFRYTASKGVVTDRILCLLRQAHPSSCLAPAPDALTKLDYAAALKYWIELEAHFDRQLDAAIARRNAVLEQFAKYRAALGKREQGVEAIISELRLQNKRWPFDPPTEVKQNHRRPGSFGGSQ